MIRNILRVRFYHTFENLRRQLSVDKKIKPKDNKNNKMLI